MSNNQTVLFLKFIMILHDHVNNKPKFKKGSQEKLVI